MLDLKDKAKKMFVYLSELLDMPVIDSRGEAFGKLYDIIVKPSAVYPQSSHLIIRQGFFRRKYAVVNWPDIREVDDKEINLSIEKSKIVFKKKQNSKEELTLRRDILDQQVVDTYNHKVIRVNDVHLLEVDHCLMIAHVDISLRGLVRRLGFEKITDFMVALFNKNAGYLKEEHLISWKHIQPLSINPASMTIKVDLSHKQLNSIPAADLGEIFSDLNPAHQIALFKSLDLAAKTKIFVSIDFKTQKSLMEDLEPKEAAEILNNIPSDEATDFLEKLPKDKVEQLLGLIENKYSKKLSELLGYSSDSAGGLMTTEYVAFLKGTSVEAVLRQIKERTVKAETPQFVYILDAENKLSGSTNLRRLIAAEAQDLIEKTAFPRTYSVHLNSSVKEVAYLMEKYKYYVIPVVDENNTLQGVITVDDILSQLTAIAWRRFKRIKVKPQT